MKMANVFRPLLEPIPLAKELEAMFGTNGQEYCFVSGNDDALKDSRKVEISGLLSGGVLKW